MIYVFNYSNWILFVNLLGTLVTMIALMVKRTEYPSNYYLLALFTIFQSLSVGFICKYTYFYVD